MKHTLWDEIEWSECKILETYDASIKVAHPRFPRPRYFIKSLKGNWYWRNTGKESGLDPFARGIIIKGDKND
jgi:hypothetical protein